MTSALEHRSLREMIVEDLRGRILGKSLAPGAKVDVPGFAAAYGVSPGSVREAIIVLQAEGLVRVNPRRGITVRTLTSDDLLEIYEVREVIDTAAACQLAARVDSTIASLVQAQQQIEQAWDSGGFTQGLEADLRFHVLLSRLGGNSRMAAISASLADQTRLHLQPVESVDTSIRDRPPTDLHLQIVEAIRSGDECRIRDSVADHYAFSRTRITHD
jgi:DNA-binding GntR family transcriptional regulator